MNKFPQQSTKSQPKMQLTLKNLKKPESSIKIDLRNWNLLASSGAHWIFVTKQSQQKNQQFFGPHLEHKRHLYECGKYVMRMRKNKQLEKMLKNYLDDSFFTLQNEQKIQNDSEQNERQLKSSISKKQKTKKSLKHDQKMQEVSKGSFGSQKISEKELNNLINKIYGQFLGIIFGQEPSDSSILPQISFSLVRPSEPYSLSQEHPQKPLEMFANFLIQEICSFFLKNQSQENKIQKLQSKDFNFEFPHINAAQIIKKFSLKQMTFSFEPNQLLFPQIRLQNKKSSQNQIFQVFEFKPKTIIPDLYTQNFIHSYLDLHPQNQSDLKRVIEQSFKTSSIQKNGCLKKFDSRGTFFNIECTRWFKKNCLSKSQNNHNPLSFFSQCFKEHQVYNFQSELQINFRNQKDLKLQKNISQKSSQNKGKLFFSTDSNRILSLKIIDYINERKRIEPIEEGLSLMEEILALQMIDLNDKKYQDILEIHEILDQIKSKIFKKSIGQQNQHQQKKEFAQEIYPEKVYLELINYFRPEVYKKSVCLSETLQNVIQRSPEVKKYIISVFGDQKCQDLQYVGKIKKNLFYVVRFLISLTWKDVSIFIQTLTHQGEQQNQGEKQQKKTKIIRGSIIDYGIKTTENIRKNIQKQKDFLRNYELFIRQKKLSNYVPQTCKQKQ